MAIIIAWFGSVNIHSSRAAAFGKARRRPTALLGAPQQVARQRQVGTRGSRVRGCKAGFRIEIRASCV